MKKKSHFNPRTVLALATEAGRIPRKSSSEQPQQKLRFLLRNARKESGGDNEEEHGRSCSMNGKI